MAAATASAWSQSTVHTQSLYWTRYQNQLFFSTKLYWNNEFDNRRFFHPDVQNQFIIHSRLHFKKNSWDFGGGITLSWIYSQIPEEGFDKPVAEVRGVAEVSHQLKLGKSIFQNRVRLDNRFFQENPDKSVFEESFFVLRFRYRAQLTIPLKSTDDNELIVALRIADEIMFNHTRNTFDQNRIYVTFDVKATKNLTAEAGYIYIYQQRFGTERFFERHVMRVTLLHKIWLN
jgi:hypothetical protein